MGFPGGSEGKASAYSAGDPGSIPASGRYPGEGNGNPLQYSCLENAMDGGAWWAAVHGIPKSHTQLSNFTSLLADRGRGQTSCTSRDKETQVSPRVSHELPKRKHSLEEDSAQRPSQGMR